MAKYGRENWLFLAVVSLVVLAVILDVSHFFSRGALWLDEAFVATNIKERALLQLFGPLEFNQHFPRFFLAYHWLLARWLGYETWVLRITSFVFGIAAVLFWVRLFWKFLVPHFLKIVSLVVFLLFFANYDLYRYAAELKPYSFDLFSTAFGFWWMVRKLDQNWAASYFKWLVLVAVWTMPSLINYSYPFFLAAGFGALFLTSDVRQRAAKLSTLFVAIFAGLVLSYYGGAKYTQDPMADLVACWMPQFIHGESIGAWMLMAIEGIGRQVGGWWMTRQPLIWNYLAVFTALAGLKRLVQHRKQNDELWLMVAVGWILLAEFVALAILKKVPIGVSRLSLYYFPFALAMIGFGLDVLSRSGNKALRLAGFAVVAIYLVFAAGLKIPRLTWQFLRFQHWDDVDLYLPMLDKTKSNYVVVAQGNQAQMRAHPHPPAEFKFVLIRRIEKLHVEDEEFREAIKGDFYYLVSPYEGFETFTDVLKSYGKFEPVRIAEYLYLVRKVG